MSTDGVFSPRLTQYLASLPMGLLSHPQASTKADFSLILRKKLAPQVVGAAAPSAVKMMFSAPWQAGEWIPTTNYVALCAVARDRLWTTPEAYHQGMVDVATEMYQGPVFRTLFAMFGPSLVAMGAARRWGSLHQGTQLTVRKQHKEGVDLTVDYPAKLLSEDGVRSLGAAFCAIALASRGTDASFAVGACGDTSAQLSIHWKYW